MLILSHTLFTTTKYLLSSRAGLLTPLKLMEHLSLAKLADKHFTHSNSNRAFPSSVYIQTFILMFHAGFFRLDDVTQLNSDKALLTLLSIKKLPTASALGNWLRSRSL